MDMVSDPTAVNQWGALLQSKSRIMIISHTENQTRVIMTLKRESSTCLQNDYPWLDFRSHLTLARESSPLDYPLTPPLTLVCFSVQCIGASCTLSLKSNAPWNHWLALRPRVKVMWPRSGHISSWEFVTGHKRGFLHTVTKTRAEMKYPKKLI